MDERATIADLERRLAAAGAALHETASVELALRQGEELRRIALERLHESEARHRLLIESGAQAVWETDASGVVVADSPSWRAYTGQTLEEWLGYGWLDAIHPDDRAHAERQWRQAIAARGLVNAEFRLRAPDGGWRWTNVRAAPVLDAGGAIEKWSGLNIDIDARKRAEAALRENEERQAFLLRLSDTLRPLADPVAVEGEACRLLAEHLDVDRAYYVEVDEAAGTATVERDFVRGGAPSLAGRHRVADFAWSVAILRGGECHVIPDTQASDLVPPADRPAAAALGIIACMGAPLLKGGRLVGALCVTASRPRAWTGTEVGILRETGERIWAAVEQARAEAARRESEERFRSFAETSADTLWIVDAATGRLEYLSPAFEAMWGEPRGAVLADIGRWRELIHPEDRERASGAMAQVLAGRVHVAEYRIVRPSDGAVRWIRDTGFPIRGAAGQVRRVGGIAQDVTDHHQAIEHQRVLLAELQHRVRNTLGVVRSIARRTKLTSTSLDEYADALADRLGAFARVQSMVTRAADTGVNLGEMLAEELLAHGAQEGERARVEGPEVRVRGRAVDTLGLVMHELATNAVKHGALAGETGRVDVSWTVQPGADGERRLHLVWQESGAAIAALAPRRRGFGSELLERQLAYELKAETTITYAPGGITCTIDVPLVRLTEAST